jgi:RNA polymerase sigma factor (sigma-70 family)
MLAATEVVTMTHVRYPLFPEGDDALTDLVREAQRGRAGAVDTILARLRPALFRFFARRLPREDAEDSTQQALLRIRGALARIDPSHATQYLVRLATNLGRSQVRRLEVAAHRFVPVELAESMESPFTADGDAECDDLRRALERASRATLPPRHRAVILGLLDGETIGEIAHEQGVTPTTIRTRLVRTRRRLRAELDRSE